MPLSAGSVSTIVVDVEHYDADAEPRDILVDRAQRLTDLPVLFFGVRCAVEIIMARRHLPQPGHESRYVAGEAGSPPPQLVRDWQYAADAHGFYDIEVDTTERDAKICTDVILGVLDRPPTGNAAFERFARKANV